MNIRSAAFLLLVIVSLSACEKNTVSKIPNITLTGFTPDSVRINVDTAFIQFTITDGDADLGGADGGDIYIKDMRYDTGFAAYTFPDDLNREIEDPKKGLKATCVFQLQPYLLTPRMDSAHLDRDTTRFELFIKDRAGDSSNHIITGRLIMHQ